MHTRRIRDAEELSRTKLRTGHKSSKVAKMYDHYTMEDEVELVERLKFPELNKYLDEPLSMPMKRKPTAIAEKPIKRMVRNREVLTRSLQGAIADQAMITLPRKRRGSGSHVDPIKFSRV